MWSYIAGGSIPCSGNVFHCPEDTMRRGSEESKNRLAAYNAQTAALNFLKAFAAEHPEVTIHTILPREENIKKVLAALSQIEEKRKVAYERNRG